MEFEKWSASGKSPVRMKMSMAAPIPNHHVRTRWPSLGARSLRFGTKDLSECPWAYRHIHARRGAGPARGENPQLSSFRRGSHSLLTFRRCRRRRSYVKGLLEV